MKKGLLFLLFIVTLISCKKDNEITDLKNEISGTWELEQKLCGYCINSITNYPPGNKNLIVLSANGNFTRNNQDTLVFKGSYTIQLNKECNQSSGDMALIINEGSTPTPRFIKITTDKLTLSTPYCYQDGVISIYRRIQ